MKVEKKSGKKQSWEILKDVSSLEDPADPKHLIAMDPNRYE